jgi:hypothetical protein
MLEDGVKLILNEPMYAPAVYTQYDTRSMKKFVFVAGRGVAFQRESSMNARELSSTS